MKTASPPQGFVALDVFRGLAAWLMVVNHAGFAWLSPEAATSGWAGGLVFLGGFAPVLFFFATGAGMGLSTGRLRRPGGLQDLLWKAGLLVVADQLLFLRHGQAWGLDFFGFIALSMVVVSLVDATRHPVRNALLLASLLLVARYGLVPLLKHGLPDQAWVHFLLGSQVVPNVSYPLAPWLTFPLVAYGLARLGWFPSVAAVATSASNKRTMVIVLLGASLVLASLVLFMRGGTFYRWGSMNAAFFMLAVGVIAWFVVFAETLDARGSRLANAVSLRGVAAFLVVPVHYAMIQGVAGLWPAPWSTGLFLVAVVVAVVLSFAVSRWLAQGIATWPQQALLPLLALLVVALALTVWLAPSGPTLAFVAATVGQLLAASLLNMRALRRQAPAMLPR
jgi:hypothetical protein